MITAYKLITGEEIIGELVEENEETFILGKVHKMSYTNSPEGLAYTMIPYMLSNVHAELEFLQNDVITSVEVDQDIEKTFLKETTGLDIATSFGV